MTTQEELPKAESWLWDRMVQYKLSLTAAGLVILAFVVTGLTKDPKDEFFHALFHGPATHILSFAVLTFVLERVLRLETHKMFEMTLISVLSKRDPVLERSISQACTSAATELLNRLPNLPAQLFPASTQPDPCFNKVFRNLLNNSGFYYIKGSKACQASWRLCRLGPNDAERLNDVHILVLDPTDDDLIQAHAELTLGSRAGSRSDAILAKMQEIRLDIYLTVLALAKRTNRTVKLSLHRDYAFFRCEIFPGGLFLSFYSRGDPFPGSYLYPNGSNVYAAYHADILHHIHPKFGQMILPLSSASPSSENAQKELLALLDKLGCSVHVGELERLLDERFTEYDALHRADQERP